jgi:Flp pilus assembly pilin Flp
MKSFLKRFLEDESGQDLVEYTLLIVFVFLAIIGLANGFHDNIAGVSSSTNHVLAEANSAIVAGAPAF